MIRSILSATVPDSCKEWCSALQATLSMNSLLSLKTGRLCCLSPSPVLDRTWGWAGKLDSSKAVWLLIAALLVTPSWVGGGMVSTGKANGVWAVGSYKWRRNSFLGNVDFFLLDLVHPALGRWAVQCVVVSLCVCVCARTCMAWVLLYVYIFWMVIFGGERKDAFFFIWEAEFQRIFTGSFCSGCNEKGWKSILVFLVVGRTQIVGLSAGQHRILELGWK